MSKILIGNKVITESKLRDEYNRIKSYNMIHTDEKSRMNRIKESAIYLNCDPIELSNALAKMTDTTKKNSINTIFRVQAEKLGNLFAESATLYFQGKATSEQAMSALRDFATHLMSLDDAKQTACQTALCVKRDKDKTGIIDIRVFNKRWGTELDKRESAQFCSGSGIRPTEGSVVNFLKFPSEVIAETKQTEDSLELIKDKMGITETTPNSEVKPIITDTIKQTSKVQKKH
jgi:hypothetical protein